MDIAVFSDVHGNHSALQAAIDYSVGKGITNFVLLGDYVTDCPNPQKTMELIYVLKQYFTTYIIATSSILCISISKYSVCRN